jgi:AbrB family looped-hinge helix DNA binding protein
MASSKMMTTTTLTSKGQLTLPKEIRDRLGLKSGDKLSCRVSGDEIVMRRKNVRLADIIGILHVPGKRATVEEMNEAVRQTAAERAMRGLKRS